MFIESWIVVVFVVYLVYVIITRSIARENYNQSVAANEKLASTLVRNKIIAGKILCSHILECDKKIISKLPKKHRDAVLKDQAAAITKSMSSTNIPGVDYSYDLEISDLFDGEIVLGSVNHIDDNGNISSAKFTRYVEEELQKYIKS